MTDQRFASVWDALADTAAEAESLKLRAALMTELKLHMERRGLDEAAAAHLFGVTRPRIGDLAAGRIDLFNLDALVAMLASAGLHIELTVAEAA